LAGLRLPRRGDGVIVSQSVARGGLDLLRGDGTGLEQRGVTRQAITKHLDTLAGAGLVHDVRSGRERIRELETGRLEHVRRCLDEISNHWDAAVARLQAFVEREE
jgi:DNA-binding transcriptional ArsR family regulator